MYQDRQDRIENSELYKNESREEECEIKIERGKKKEREGGTVAVCGKCRSESVRPTREMGCRYVAVQ